MGLFNTTVDAEVLVKLGVVTVFAEFAVARNAGELVARVDTFQPVAEARFVHGLWMKYSGDIWLYSNNYCF